MGVFQQIILVNWKSDLNHVANKMFQNVVLESDADLFLQMTHLITCLCCYMRCSCV